MADDDLIMESTTDSPEQIAEGLGVTAPAVETSPDDVDDTTPVDEPDDADAPIGDPATDEPAISDPPALNARGTAAKAPKTAKVAKPQLKSVHGAAAAARRQSAAKLLVLTAERDAALARVKELAAGGSVAAPAPKTAATSTVVEPDTIADTHPRIAAILAKITALGAKPKQADFADFEEFEEKRDTWIEERARLRARADSVREDVAHRETIALEEANRAAKTTQTSYETSVDASKGRHADYDDVMAAAREQGLTVSPDVRTALFESPDGGEVTYYLCKNPQEVTRLNGLSPHRQLAELGVLEGRIRASIKTPGKAPLARTTRAPDPQDHLVGDLPSSRKAREVEDFSDATLSQAEYNRVRDEQDRASGRRLH